MPTFAVIMPLVVLAPPHVVKNNKFYVIQSCSSVYGNKIDDLRSMGGRSPPLKNLFA